MAKYFDSYFAPVTSYVDAYFGLTGGVTPTTMSTYAFSLLVAAAVYKSTLAGDTYVSVLSPGPTYRSGLS